MGQSTEIDWKNFGETVKKASREAAADTDLKLAGEMAAITNLTAQEIQDIFPEKTDKENFSELMAIVKSSTSQNQKINKIVDNTEKFGKVIVSILNKFF